MTGAAEDLAPPEILDFADVAGLTLAVRRLVLVPGCCYELEQVSSLFQDDAGLPVIARPRTRRCVHVDGLPELNNFEVPTGAFSYGGRLYIFVARRKAGGVMHDSHLAVTEPPKLADRIILDELRTRTDGGHP
ncbi:hypothetical protein [Streptomyces sp. NPDC000410]|uniref:hypothetical protein n=1 Tax=Streptomyces sp. NPDC000410 TaxID=3154254 RepID=UPI00331C2E68